jgi:hypothetical protein
MGRKGGIALLMLGVALAVVMWHLLASREPMHEGKSLSYYLDQLAVHYPQKSAEDPDIKAIRAMGPKAVPHLRRAFRRKNSLFLKAATLLRPKLPSFISRRLPDHG